jgi:hypothetical protein
LEDLTVDENFDNTILNQNEIQKIIEFVLNTEKVFKRMFDKQLYSEFQEAEDVQLQAYFDRIFFVTDSLITLPTESALKTKLFKVPMELLRREIINHNYGITIK